jgi:hypothetical protein
MKKTALTLLALCATLSVFAQGTITFNNASSGNGVSTRMFGPEVGDPQLSKVGNRSNDTPTGTQTYTGALLTGSGFVATLWGAPGTGVAEGSLLLASSGGTTSFRTGAAAGAVAATTATFNNIPKDFGGGGTFQVRVWDNSSGLYATWAAALPAWQNGTIAAGVSPLLNLNAIIGGDFNGAPYLAGLQSFNIYTAIPEPSSFVLAGLGAAGLLIFRRRK